ncbi:MAG: UDP-N-acetylmuramoyl-L-alanine--D-glutamate ligase [Sorangiineae bacterium PRO1]|nr:UDP-N-acetylmuramoyl-L-alanine--D-glutamate ligase [Sorangiineae bacterium PRO1]
MLGPENRRDVLLDGAQDAAEAARVAEPARDVALIRRELALGDRRVGVLEHLIVGGGEELIELGRLLGGHAGVDFSAADLIVVSPGVPPLPELARAERAGVPVIGEMELAARLIGAPIVAIGGTNGKSTTTTLVARMLEATGKRIFAGANLGAPACDAVEGGFDVVVFEVSSFQLERAPKFSPKVSVLLNISEDHLDRYSSYQEYANAKGNAFANQGEEDSAVVPAGDAACLAQARRGRGKLSTFGAGGDYEVRGRQVIERASGESFSLVGVDLHGRHNLDNAAAAIAAVRALGVAPEAIAAGLGAFHPLHHRMALVRALGGVHFYDDSKGTNVGAAVTALAGLEEPKAVLIAGGRDKLGSYGPLVDALEKKGRAVVVIGEAASRIADAVGARVPVARAASMAEAVRVARSLAGPGDAVLLSPACSSYDMFVDYVDRGNQFAAAVSALEEA